MLEFGPAVDESIYIPEMLVVGSLHGDEGVGYEISMQLVEHLCEHYSKDYKVKTVTSLLTLIDFWRFWRIFRNTRSEFKLHQRFHCFL